MLALALISRYSSKSVATSATKSWRGDRTLH